MTRTLIDVDDDALELAKVALGTQSKVETVNAALRLAGGREARIASYRRLTEALDHGDLCDPEVMASAWR